MDTRDTISEISAIPAMADSRGAREHPVADAGSAAIVVRQTTYPSGFHITPHWHARAQFLFAVSGTMTVRTLRHGWIVPPSRALWIPAGTVHEIRINGTVEMRSLYIEPAAAAGMWDECVVLEVTSLARELVVRAGDLPLRYDEGGDDGLLMRLLLAEIRRLSVCALDLPLPESADLVRLCERVLSDLSARRPCRTQADDLAMSTRTLYRRFLKETGITFARWQQQARLLDAIRRLAEGASVTATALDLGYESTSAFSAMFRRSLGQTPRAFVAGCCNHRQEETA
jgi:AraC-like DNA-binding protein/quercetin dioxygenase-like cupin family protein